MEPQSTAGHLKAVPLTWDHCQSLARRLPSSETMECLADGYQPEQALAAGLLWGLSLAVLRDEDPAGAFGYTTSGIIWSLWSPLSRRESVDILRLSREWVPHMVTLSGRPTLHNRVHCKNTKAIEWIEATGCFSLDTANPVRNLDGSESFPFETFPPHVPEGPHHV